MAPSTTSSAPSTALSTEIVISWWKDWQSFLRLRLEMNTLRARLVSVEAFDQDQDDTTRREREITDRLNAIPSVRRAVFEAELETHRQRFRALREVEQGSAADLDLHEIDRAAIEALLDIAEGNRDESRPAAVPTEGGVWYDVDPLVVEQVPDAATYSINRASRGPSRNVLMIVGVAAIWIVIGAIYFFTRPQEAVAVATALEATVNDGPLQPWPVRMVRLSSRDLPVSVVDADIWPAVPEGRAGWKAGTVLPMEMCVPKVEAGALPDSLTLLGAGSHMDRVATLLSKAPANPILRLVTCGGDETLAYGALAETTPQASVAVGETWVIPDLGNVWVADVRAVGPGQDTTIPPGRVQVVVSLNAPAGVDWPSYTPNLTLPDGTVVRSSEIRVATSGGSASAIYDVAAEKIQGLTAVMWELTDPKPTGGTYRWSASVTPPRSRMEELSASTRLAITEAGWKDGRLKVKLLISNASTHPLAIGAGDFTVIQDEAPITVPSFPEGSLLVVPGKNLDLSLDLFASSAQPVMLYLGATGVVISPPAP